MQVKQVITRQSRGSDLSTLSFGLGCSTFVTMRFTESQLRDKALLALREAYEQAQAGPIPKSFALRFVLAYPHP